MIRSSFLPSLALGLCATIALPADAGAEDTKPPPHPLLSDEARALGAGRLSRAEAEDLLARLDISEWSTEDADGVANSGSRVALRDTEPLHERPAEDLPDPGVVLHPDLRRDLEAGALSDEPRELAIGLRTEGSAVRGTWGTERLLGYLTGEIADHGDEEHVRLAWIAERQAAGKQLIDWFVASEPELEVLERNEFTATLVVRAPERAVERLAEHAGVRQLEPRAESQQDAGHA